MGKVGLFLYSKNKEIVQYNAKDRELKRKKYIIPIRKEQNSKTRGPAGPRVKRPPDRGFLKFFWRPPLNLYHSKPNVKVPPLNFYHSRPTVKVSTEPLKCAYDLPNRFWRGWESSYLNI